MEGGGKVNADFCLEQSGEWWLLSQEGAQDSLIMSITCPFLDKLT